MFTPGCTYSLFIQTQVKIIPHLTLSFHTTQLSKRVLVTFKSSIKTRYFSSEFNLANVIIICHFELSFLTNFFAIQMCLPFTNGCSVWEVNSNLAYFKIICHCTLSYQLAIEIFLPLRAGGGALVVTKEYVSEYGPLPASLLAQIRYSQRVISDRRFTLYVKA